MSARIEFITRKEAAQRKRMPEYSGSLFFNTGSKSFFGGCLSPFVVSGIGIPVPGSQDLSSKSVEGIWQGLKVIDGKTDFSLFASDHPKKRKFEPYPETQFAYAGRIIGMAEARKRIYRPAYKFFFDVVVPPAILDLIVRAHHGGLDQYFYDVDDNADIEDISCSFSHSALLAELLRDKIACSGEALSESVLKLLRSVDHGDDGPVAETVAEVIKGYLLNELIAPSVLEFATWLHFSLAEHLPEGAKDVRETLFRTLAEAYANRTGYTFGEAMETKPFRQIFLDTNMKWKGVRKLLMCHVKILE